MAKKKATTTKTTDKTDALATTGNGELVALNNGKYALAQFTPEQLHEAVAMNFEGEELRPQDLDRVRMPSGGGISFEVPQLDGEIEPVKMLRGIIVAHHLGRAYWKESLDDSGGGTPPDCASRDGKNGQGDPGGLCSKCKLNEFGTGKKERGKACKEMKLIFLLQPTSLLPIVVVLPPTSLQAFKKYLMRLTMSATPYSKVETEISLEKDHNADGIEYAKAKFKVAQKLDEASANFVTDYARSMQAAFESIDIGSDDATGMAD
jgi:hypothetical protein